MRFLKKSEWAFLLTWLSAIFLAFAIVMPARSAEWWEPVMDPAGSYVPAGYQLAFNDEFNGLALNRSKWATRYIYANGTLDQLKTELQRYRDNDNHVLGGGSLALTARKVGSGYESGMIRSLYEFKPSPTKSYYVEARLRMPAGRGVFPAFWLNSGVGPSGKLFWGPEIDVAEFVVNGTEENPDGAPKKMVHSNVVTHEGRIPSELLYQHANYRPEWGLFWAKSDLTTSWHTFGLEWTNSRITQYTDGVATYSRSYSWIYDDDQQPAGSAHLLLNLAIGGQWAGKNGVDDSKFPQALMVDWVRAYGKAVAK